MKLFTLWVTNFISLVRNRALYVRMYSYGYTHMLQVLNAKKPNRVTIKIRILLLLLSLEIGAYLI